VTKEERTMTRRRDFVKTLGAAALGSALPARAPTPRPRAPRTPGRGVRHEQPQYCSGSARSHSKFPWERGSFLRRRQRAVAHRTRLAARSVVALFRRGLTKGDAVCNQTAARCPFHCARARPEANLTRGLPPAARPFATPAQGPQTFSKPFHAPACVRQGRWRTRYS